MLLGDGKYHLVDHKVRSVYSLAERVCTWRVVGLIEIDVTSIPMLLFHKHADGIHECCNEKKINKSQESNVMLPLYSNSLFILEIKQCTLE